MSASKPKNLEFRNFITGIIYSLGIASFLFLAILLVLKVGHDIPALVSFQRWSGISDAINLVFGLPIAFAGAYVAISIASRTQDLSERQQSQQDYRYYEQLHEQLIDNYFDISRAADHLVSAANRFEEAFWGRLKQETSSRFAFMNFIDAEHRRSYIQDMLQQNRDGISDRLSELHQDIREHINGLLEAIDVAFKHAAVNETWELSTADPGYKSLLAEGSNKGLCRAEFTENGREWLLEAKNEILERLDLHQIQDAIDQGENGMHPLLPYCLYVSDLYDLRRKSEDNGWYVEVLLAGYFLMAHESTLDQNSFFNSGALFLMDLIETLPSSEHVRLAFARRHADTEAAFCGTDPVALEEHYAAAIASSKRVDTHTHHLFLVLSRNIQFTHYSPRIRKTRQSLVNHIQRASSTHDAFRSLQVRYEQLQRVEASDKFD